MDFSKPDNARVINRMKVLSELRRGGCSRAELSRRLGINKVSIGDMIQGMVSEGIIKEGKKDRSSPGRPGTIVSIERSAGRVLVLDIRQRSISVSASDLSGSVLRYERFPRNGLEEGTIEAAINRMCSGENVRLYGSAIISSEPLPDLPELPKPCMRISRAVAEAAAETAASDNLDNTLFLSWSDSFDAAILKDTLIPLPTLAHIRVRKDGECSCGGRGCLEAAASGKALMAASGAPSVRDLVRNSSYASVMMEAMKPIAMALAESLQATAASKVMITGDLSQLPDDAYAHLQNLIASLLPPGRDAVVFRSLLGEKGAREGAAIMALDAFFYHTDLLRKLEAIADQTPSLWNAV